MKILCFVLLFTIILLVGCTNKSAGVESILSKDCSIIETKYPNGDDVKMNNCKLIINGIEVVDSAYINIDIENRFAEVPLLLIVNALGSDFEWRSGVLFIDGVNSGIDPANDDFGLIRMPGQIHMIRKKIDGDLIFDSTSIKGILYNMLNATIDIDYTNMVINVNTGNVNTGDGSLC